MLGECALTLGELFLEFSRALRAEKGLQRLCGRVRFLVLDAEADVAGSTLTSR